MPIAHLHFGLQIFCLFIDSLLFLSLLCESLCPLNYFFLNFQNSKISGITFVLHYFGVLRGNIKINPQLKPQSII